MQTFCDLAIKSDQFQSSPFITQRNLNFTGWFLRICVILALIAPVNTSAQETPLDVISKVPMGGLQYAACNSCLQVLLKLKNNDPHIWKTCDFCLKLLKLEPNHPAVVKKIKQIKKRLLYKRINALKKLFRYEKKPNHNKQSEVSKDMETSRILSNIVTILEYLKKVNAMFGIGSSEEIEQLNINIEKYKKLLNRNKTK
ncbi:hypothetical protein QUF90_07040 [Desulfococcaceae bacterium HSG9]|nr:hypothetical protein [Desulfococcaceae bacterium HSG9]